MPRKSVPECCVKCGSTKLKRIANSKVIHRPIAGTIGEFDYGSIRWTRTRCECGQVAIVKTYLP